MDRPARLLYVYAPEDESLQGALAKHLAPLEKQQLIRGWHVGCVRPGEQPQAQFDEQLSQADIVIVLLSSDLLASEQNYPILERALALHTERDVHVVPVIVRPVDLTGSIFTGQKLWPLDGKPVTTWVHQDEAWVQIKQAVSGMIGESSVRPGAEAQSPATVQSTQGATAPAAGFTIESLLRGMGALSVGQQIRKFFSLYLGTPERPEPFGGRRQELDALLRWLDSDSEPPCLVLAAPAGCGKSALLSHFCAELLARQDVAVLFFPVSIRLETNLQIELYRALVSRLAWLHGEPVPTPERTSLTEWRLLLDQYLSRPLAGRRLLLILDGLDEASDWQASPSLLPTRPHRGLRILVSARYRPGDLDASGWRHLLGWESPAVSRGMTLAGLSVDGVAEALGSLGMPLAERSDIVVQIYRLTEGQPLLVQLWAHVLWQWQQGEQAFRLTPAQLQGYPPGLKGYLKNLWETRTREERTALKTQKAAKLVLELLACALAPLSRDELLALTPEIPDWLELSEALQPLSRFVFGDGKQQGYVLTHSLLRDYFRDEWLDESTRRAYDRRFLDYGAQILAEITSARLEPKQVPRYVLRCYGAHLDRANAGAAQRLALVCDGWRQAWANLEGGYGGFLVDVQRAWSVAEAEDLARVSKGQAAQWLGACVQCALCVASVCTASTGIGANLLKLLVERELWTPAQALAYVQQMQFRERAHDQKRVALCTLLPHLADELLPTALDVALDLANTKPNETIQPLLDMAERLAKTHPHLAVSATADVQSTHNRAIVMAALAQYICEPRQQALLLEGALRIVRTYPHPWGQIHLTQVLAKYLPEPLRCTLLQEAVSAVDLVEKALDRVLGWGELIPLLPKRQRVSALYKALDAACQIEETHRLSVILELLNLFPKQTRRKVLQISLKAPGGPLAVLNWAWDSRQGRSMGPPWPEPDARLKLLEDTVGRLELQRLVDLQLVSLRAASDVWPLVRFLMGTFPVLSEQQLAEATNFLRHAKNPIAGVRGLCNLAPLLPEALKLEVLEQALALPILDEHGHHDDRSQPLQGVFCALTGGQLDSAEVLVRRAHLPVDQAWAYILLAHRLPSRRVEFCEAAHNAAQLIEFIPDRAKALFKLAGFAEGYQQVKLIEECYATILQIEDPRARLTELQTMGRLLALPWRDNFFKAALDAALKAEKQYSLPKVLNRLLSDEKISDGLRNTMLHEALRAARGQVSPRSRASDLVDLCRHLSIEDQPSLLREALAASRQIYDQEAQLSAAAALRPSEDAQRKLLVACKTLDPKAQLRLLRYGLWPHATASVKQDIASYEPEVVRALGYDNPRHALDLANCLQRVSDVERPSLATEALTEACILFEKHRESIWAPPPSPSAALAFGEEVVSILQAALPLILPYLPEAQVEAVYEMVPLSWSGVITAVLSRLSQPRRGEFLQQALCFARQAEVMTRAAILADLVSVVPPDERSDLVSEVLCTPIIDQVHQATVLCAIAPYFEEPHLPGVLTLVLAVCEPPSNLNFLADALERMHPHLRQSVVDVVVQALPQWSPEEQGRALAICADLVPHTWHESIVLALPRIVDQRSEKPLSVMMTRVDSRLLPIALQSTLESIGDQAPTDSQLKALAFIGSELLRRKGAFQSEVFCAVSSMLRRQTKARHDALNALQSLAPLVPLLGGDTASDQVAEAILQAGAWWP